MTSIIYLFKFRFKGELEIVIVIEPQSIRVLILLCNYDSSNFEIQLQHEKHPKWAVPFHLIPTMFRDLIRNYKMILKGRHNSDSDSSEEESQPLMASASSLTPQFGSFHSSGIFKQDSLSESETKSNRFVQSIDEIPAILIQKKLDRQVFYKEPDNTDLDFLEKYNYNHYNEDFNGDGEVVVINGSTHSSLVTIFAIWNTTVGSSLLAISWGIEKTGLFPAIVLNVLVALICLFTTYTLLKINEKHGIVGSNGEVCDLCRSLLGRWAEIVAKIFSLIVLIGANIVYWILMSNFFYYSIHFLYGLVFDVNNGARVNVTVICPKNDNVIALGSPDMNVSKFDVFWDLHSTVPVILAVIMFPMLNWKSPTFFTKFNSLGTFSVLYIIIFVGTKAWSWGVNVDSWTSEFAIKPTFCALSGMLSLSYFIHNIIISIMRNNKHQEHNGRDLSIAFSLVTFTYIFIGAVFYITFPLPKICIEDNILNNFDQFDVMTLIARILLMFQLFTVFPLMSYMLRNDVFANIKMIFRESSSNFNYKRVIVLNVSLLAICVLFACFLPRIGTLIRYTGALSGLVYIFMLPSLLKIASLRKEGALTYPQLMFHIGIMVLGVVNLISQFFISDQ